MLSHAADAVSLRCLKNGEHGGRTTEITTAFCRNMLVVADARTEAVSEFIVAATEALG